MSQPSSRTLEGKYHAWVRLERNTERDRDAGPLLSDGKKPQRDATATPRNVFLSLDSRSARSDFGGLISGLVLRTEW